MTRIDPEGHLGAAAGTSRFARLEAALVAVAAFALFAPTIPFELVWDDVGLQAVVEQKAGTDGLGGLLASEFQISTDTHTGYFRPVVLASLWVDGRLARFVPGAYHTTNVLLHAVNAVLVLLLLGRLVGSRWLALGGALLFAVHPIHTEAVAFVSGRTDLWAAFFGFLSSLFWLMARGPGARMRSGLAAASLAALLLGILSKESAIVLPGALLLLDAVVPPPATGWWARNGRWLFGWMVVAGIAIGLRLWVGVPLGPPQGTDVTPRTAVQIVGSLLFQLRLMVAPWPLSAFYGPDAIRITMASTFASAALVAGAIALARNRSHRLAWAGLGWMVLFLVPTLGFVPLGGAVAADRFAYLPSFGLSVLAALGCGWLSARVGRPRLVALAFALVLGTLAFSAAYRTRVWKDSVSLREELARTSPAYNAIQIGNLAVKMSETGRHEAAVRMLQEALVLQPASTELHNNLAVTLSKLGKFEEALAEYREAERLGDRRPGLYVGMGELCLSLGRPKEAVQAYGAAVAASPRSVEARMGLGRALLRDRRTDEAFSEVASLAAFDPVRAAELRREIELPQPIDSVQLPVRTAGGEAALMKLVAVTMPVGERRAAVVVADQDVQQVLGQIEFAGSSAELRRDIDAFTADVLRAVKVAHGELATDGPPYADEARSQLRRTVLDRVDAWNDGRRP